MIFFKQLKKKFKKRFKARKFNPDAIIIQTHMGLGDQIICNGLVRELIKRIPERTIFLPTKLHNVPTVLWMYKDLPNLFVVPVETDREAEDLPRAYRCKYRFIGCENFSRIPFLEAFYQEAEVDVACRWTSSVYWPGPNSKILMTELNPQNLPYRLVHNESTVGEYLLNLPDDGLLTIKVQPLTNNQFDWYDLIKSAVEIHAIDSSFFHLVESVLYGNNKQGGSGCKLYFHNVKPHYQQIGRALVWTDIAYDLSETK